MCVGDIELIEFVCGVFFDVLLFNGFDFGKCRLVIEL